MWWREQGRPVRGVATVRDIPAINRLFSDAFTDRYRKDGMPTIRVPFLTPLVWQFAIEGAGEGAFVWRDAHSGLAAFNLVHRSGSEGWMGPLAVRQDHQGRGLGREVVHAGIAHLQQMGARTIGLETMPRTIDNIGFYSALKFLPGPLTISMQSVASTAVPFLPGLAARDDADRAAAIVRCGELSRTVWSGRDFSAEIERTLRLKTGDVLLLDKGGEIDGFLLYHTTPLTDGRPAEEVRILKLVSRDHEGALRLIGAAQTAAHALGLPQVTLRCQGNESRLYADLIARDWRVHWTDLRMTLEGYPDQPCAGVGLSNWEI